VASHMANQSKQVVILAVLLIAAAGCFLVFRDGFGLIVFLALGLASLIQLFRVVLANGSSKTLSGLWSAFKDAFWGIG